MAASPSLWSLPSLASGPIVVGIDVAKARLDLAVGAADPAIARGGDPVRGAVANDEAGTVADGSHRNRSVPEHWHRSPVWSLRR